jgi:hypothetical protein
VISRLPDAKQLAAEPRICAQYVRLQVIAPLKFCLPQTALLLFLLP